MGYLNKVYIDKVISKELDNSYEERIRKDCPNFKSPYITYKIVFIGKDKKKYTETFNEDYWVKCEARGWVWMDGDKT